MRLTVACCWIAIVTSWAAGSATAAPAACPRFEAALIRDKASSDTRPVRSNGRIVQVDRTPIFDIDDVTEAKLGDPDDLGAADSLQIKLRPEPAALLEQITADPKGVWLAVVLDNETLLNVLFSGGYGIGKDGLQIHTEDPRRVRGLPAVINRCSAAIAGR